MDSESERREGKGAMRPMPRWDCLARETIEASIAVHGICMGEVKV